MKTIQQTPDGTSWVRLESDEVIHAGDIRTRDHHTGRLLDSPPYSDHLLGLKPADFYNNIWWWRRIDLTHATYRHDD